MRIDEWIKERDRRRRVYEKLCRQGGRLALHYDRTVENSRAVFDVVCRIDAAYLAWCETDRWEVEYDRH